MEEIDLAGVYCETCGSIFVCNCSMSWNIQEKIALNVKESILTTGFLLINCLDPAALLSPHNILNSSSQFFMQDLEVKFAFICKENPARRGYCPSEQENFAALVGEKRPNDTVEKFRIGPLLGHGYDNEDYFRSKEAQVHFTANIFPSYPSTFESELRNYYISMEILSRVLLRLILQVFNIPLSIIEDKFNHHTSILTLNNYSPSATKMNIFNKESTSIDRNISSELSVNENNPEKMSENEEIQWEMRVAEHTDVSVLTIVAQTPLKPTTSSTTSATSTSTSKHTVSSTVAVGGLEVYHKHKKEWFTVPFHPHVYVVNVGDCLSDWSKGLFCSSRHRVRLPINSARQSIAFFYTPNYDAILSWPETENEIEVNIDNKDRDSLANEVKMKDLCMKSKELRTEMEVEVESGISYTEWRKKRIKKAMQLMKKCNKKH